VTNDNNNIRTAADINEFNRKLIEEFRSNGGKVTGMFANAPLVLVTHKGAKSGKQRTSPLAYTKDGDNLVVIGSKGGSPEHPQWYLNLVANPDVTLELPNETYAARARVAQGEERTRLFRAMADKMPNFDQYQSKTERELPVVVFERV
jgi:deazaflavin-dependent oxidoreductase (nitroreductase family)